MKKSLSLLAVSMLLLAGCSNGYDKSGDVKKEGTVEVIHPKPGDLSPEERIKIAREKEGEGESQ
jgi:PBP1b-binding outer membrane lipoprotein LpoB